MDSVRYILYVFFCGTDMVFDMVMVCIMHSGGNELGQLQQGRCVPAGPGEPDHSVERAEEQPHGETQGQEQSPAYLFTPPHYVPVSSISQLLAYLTPVHSGILYVCKACVIKHM